MMFGYNRAVPKRPKIKPIRNSTLFEMGKLEHAGKLVKSSNIERPYSAPGLLLGTSSFTADGWRRFFYPGAVRDFLVCTTVDTVYLLHKTRC
jgi:hypothetical protein